jgi:hypothetical protein
MAEIGEPEKIRLYDQACKIGRDYRGQYMVVAVDDDYRLTVSPAAIPVNPLIQRLEAAAKPLRGKPKAVAAGFNPGGILDILAAEVDLPPK